MPLNPAIALTLLLLGAPQAERIIINIPTSEVVRVAQTIARNEGYDLRQTKYNYYFDALGSTEKPLLEGYTSIGFYINGNIRSTISISETTGQAFDMNSCEIFDYPELRPSQDQILRLSKAKRKTPQEMADEVGCSPPKVLTKPVPYVKKK